MVKVIVCAHCLWADTIQIQEIGKDEEGNGGSGGGLDSVRTGNC